MCLNHSMLFGYTPHPTTPPNNPSQHFKPTYERVATFFHRANVQPPLTVVRVDCAHEGKLCNEFSIPGYPTLRVGPAESLLQMSTKGTVVVQGSRSMEGVVQWLSDHLNGCVCVWCSVVLCRVGCTCKSPLCLCMGIHIYHSLYISAIPCTYLPFPVHICHSLHIFTIPCTCRPPSAPTSSLLSYISFSLYSHLLTSLTQDIHESIEQTPRWYTSRSCCTSTSTSWCCWWWWCGG